MRRNWPWARGPRRGIARGVAVFGSPGVERDASLLGGLFEDHERLAGWLSAAGQTLRYDANGLAVVEASIDSWHGNSDVAPMLANEVGTFLGTVLVKVVDGASWHVWPSGHPVVRVIPKRDIDVVDLAERRISSGRPNLTGILLDAMGH